MSVQGIGNHAAHQLPQEMRGIQKQEPVSAPVLQNDTDKPSKQSGLPEYDEYIPGEKREPIGLYKLTHDDEGNPIIEFDDPMKAAKRRKARQKKLHPPKVSQDEKRKRVPQIPTR